MNESRKPIVVIGSINMDLVAHTHQIPVPGQTVIGTGFDTTPGGKGANQAVAVARLGYPVQMVGMVGEDVFGQALLRNLSNAGVGTKAVARISGPSGVAPILVAESGENAIVVIPGANGKMDKAAVDRQSALIRSAGMVLCQLELPLETVSHVLALCADAGVPALLDPAPAAPLPDSAFRQAAWFTPNETEAAFYLGNQPNSEAAAQQLLQKGLKGVVLKRGSDGAYVAVAGKAAWVRPFPVKPIDTVAAGDCFNGAFAVALLEGNDPWAAARFASAAAAISVTRKGAQASMPSRADVERFLAERG
ncbi:MAG TPA: ribokinase [Terracidiphilus sp.]|jgi:ribokinase|nr:ribokinase [Terracidiphilus sp.]